MSSPAVERLPWSPKIGFGVGHVLNDLCASMWFIYFTVYFQHVLLFPPSLSGTLMLVGQIVDGIATPLIGYESDITSGFRNYGRRKTWHAFGSILVLLSFPFIFNRCFFALESDPWAQAVYFAPLIAIFQIGWAAVQIAHLALMPELTHCAHERVFLNSLRHFFTVFSNIFVLIVAFALLHFHSDDVVHYVPPHGLGAAATESPRRVLWYTGYLVRPLKNETFHVATDVCPANNTMVALGPKDQVVFFYISIIVVAVGLVFTVMFHLMVKEVNTTYNKKKKGENSLPVPASREYLIPSTSEEDPLLASCVQDDTYGSINRHPNHMEASTNTIATDVVSNTMSASERNMASIPPLRGFADSSSVLQAHEEEEMRWVDWLLEPQFYLVNILYMSTRIIVNGSQVFLAFYLIHTVQNLTKDSVALMPLVLYLSSMVTATIQKQFQAFVGRKKSLLLGIVVILAYSGMVRFIHYPAPPSWQIYVLITLLGVASALLLIGSLAMCCDLIGTSTESGAFVYGAMSFTDKVSNGILVQIIQVYQSSLFHHDCIDTYFFRDVQAYLCGGFGVVSLVILAVLAPMKLGQRWRYRHQDQLSVSVPTPS